MTSPTAFLPYPKDGSIYLDKVSHLRYTSVKINRFINGKQKHSPRREIFLLPEQSGTFGRGLLFFLSILKRFKFCLTQPRAGWNMLEMPPR
jgi:hypothetical protein